MKQFEAGSMKFRMYGKKLQGEFALVRMKVKEKNAWLLIKHRDQFASEEEITQQDKSVVSGKTIDEVSEYAKAKTQKSNRSSPGAVKSNDPGKSAKKITPKKAAVKRKTITPATKTPAGKKKGRTIIKKTFSMNKKKSKKGEDGPISTNKIVDERDRASLKKKVNTAVEKGGRKNLLNPTGETQVCNIVGRDLKFTNLSKVFWPEQGITKRDMLNYYYQVTPYMLPYMKDRPQTFNRFPNGIDGKSFYQKDVTGKVPAWIKTHKYFSDGDQREKHFMVCTDEPSLLYIASLGCIEMNPWSSRTQTPDHPDWCVIDLDPDKKNTFDQVIEAAQVTKEVLDTLDVPSYCKTSGSTGLHIYIPFGAKYTYEDSKEFARAIVKIVNIRLPAFTTIERKVSDRKGRMYLDFLQNRPQATLAGPYSLRPKPGAPVSMPLHWDEVRKGLRITDFTIKNVMQRLKETGDLFKGVLGKEINMKKAMNAMQILSKSDV